MASSARFSPCPQVTPTVARLSTDCGVESTARSSVSGSPVGRDQPRARGGAAAHRGLALTQRAETGLGDAGQGHVGHPGLDGRRGHQRRGVASADGRTARGGPRDGPLQGSRAASARRCPGSPCSRPGPRRRPPARTPDSAGTGARSGFCSRASGWYSCGRGNHMSTKCHSSNRGPQGLLANYKVVIRQPCKGKRLAGRLTGSASRERIRRRRRAPRPSRPRNPRSSRRPRPGRRT